MNHFNVSRVVYYGENEKNYTVFIFFYGYSSACISVQQ
jgi:hypothetical protein